MNKQIHILSDVDFDNKTATCAHCGPQSNIRVVHYQGRTIAYCRIGFNDRRRRWSKTKKGRESRFRTTDKFQANMRIRNRHKKKTCTRCNRDFPFYCLDFHHKDRNPKNNCEENLQVVCACCHRIIHYESDTAIYGYNKGVMPDDDFGIPTVAGGNNKQVTN